MVGVTFKTADGVQETIEIDAGTTLMEGAVRGGIEGIDADCGGALSCATCHVRVAPEWTDKLAPPTEAERDMLEFAVEPGPGSRLSCQIVIDPALEGLTVEVPSTQHA
jgi:2Fe-2S ferredoxin